MRELCEKCGLCCKIIPVDWEENLVLRNGAEELDNNFKDFLIPLKKKEAENINAEFFKKIINTYPNAQLFSCKYYTEDSGCTNPEPHEYCNFPSDAFSLIPDDCNYCGEIFLKNEQIKQKIRKLKEEIIDYEAQIASSKDKHEIDHLKRLIIFHQKFIGRFKFYGAKNW